MENLSSIIFLTVILTFVATAVLFGILLPMRSREFVRVGDHAISLYMINVVDLTQLPGKGLVTLHLASGKIVLEDVQAIDAVMQLCPWAWEGQKMKARKFGWAFHNLIAHPGMQILVWLKQTELALALHDYSIPRPKPVQKVKVINI